MMNIRNLSWLIQLSRPRFWAYLFGPFIVGVAAGYSNTGNTLNHESLLFLAAMFFTFPANLIIYGVNDLFDYETDKHNAKKHSYEILLEPKNRSKFIKLVSLVTIPFLVMLLAQLLVIGSVLGYAMLLGFLFFGIGYSTPPIRAKTKPFLDAFFNILYVFPGLLGYVILTDQLPSISVTVAATAWVMAMHAFSAVPDIRADKKAGIQTVATILGKQGTLLFCANLYGLAAGLTYQHLGLLSLVGVVLYWAMMLFAYRTSKQQELFAVYKQFPKINIIYGAAIFFVALLG